MKIVSFQRKLESSAMKLDDNDSCYDDVSSSARLNLYDLYKHLFASKTPPSRSFWYKKSPICAGGFLFAQNIFFDYTASSSLGGRRMGKWLTTNAIIFSLLSIGVLTGRIEAQEPEAKIEKPTLIIIGAKSEIETKFAREAWEALTEQIRQEITEIEIVSSKREETMEGSTHVIKHTPPFLCETCHAFHLCKDNRISIVRNYDKDDVGWDDPGMVLNIQEVAICAHLRKLPEYVLEEWQAIAGDVYNKSPELYSFDFYDKEKMERISQEWNSYPKNGLMDFFSSRNYLDDIRGFAYHLYLMDYVHIEEPNCRDRFEERVDWNDLRYMQKFTWLFTWGFITEEQYIHIKQESDKK